MGVEASDTRAAGSGSEHVRASLSGAGGLLEASRESPPLSPRACEAPRLPWLLGWVFGEGREGTTFSVSWFLAAYLPPSRSPWLSLCHSDSPLVCVHILQLSPLLCLRISISFCAVSLCFSLFLSLSPPPSLSHHLSCILCIVCRSCSVPFSVCYLLHSDTPPVTFGALLTSESICLSLSEKPLQPTLV